MKETIILKDTIHVTIGEDHSYNCSAVAIGRAGENNITQLEITIPEELNSFWAYLDFKTSKGETYKTPQLPIENNVIEYDIPVGLIQNAGNLEVQVVLQNENGEIWKSATKKYVVLKSLDAVNDIPFKDDFINDANQLLSEVNQAFAVAQETIQDALDKNEEVNEKYNACEEATTRANEATEELEDIKNELADGGFITGIKERNHGLILGFWAGTTKEYEALEEKPKDCYVMLTDDETLENIQKQLTAYGFEQGKFDGKPDTPNVFVWRYRKWNNGLIEMWSRCPMTGTSFTMNLPEQILSLDFLDIHLNEEEGLSYYPDAKIGAGLVDGNDKSGYNQIKFEATRTPETGKRFIFSVTIVGMWKREEE